MMKTYDICVAGGGPAGITTAVQLHRMGYKVLLITQGNKPNHQEAQSVSHGVLTMAETMKLDKERVQEVLIPIQHMRRQWSGIEEQNSQPSGFLVNRRFWDDLLLGLAKQLGIRVLQPVKLISCRYMEDLWELNILEKGKYARIYTHFLVDAMGKKTVLRGIKKRLATQTIAITGIWKNAPYPSSFTQLESAPTHWCWGARLLDEHFHATVFIDPSAITGNSFLLKQYIGALEKTTLFTNCLRGSLAKQPYAIDSTPYYYENAVGSNFIRVGEAGTGFDPQSSQGVQNAMANAIQGAIVVNTLLSHPSRQKSAIDFYNSRQKESMLSHLLKLSETYASARCWQDQPFWLDRTPTNANSIKYLRPDRALWHTQTMIQISPDAQLKSVPCIEGNLITCKMALVHPDLDRPIVYWNNLNIEHVVQPFRKNTTVSDILQSWSEIMPHAHAEQLLYAWKRTGLLVATDNQT
jgi:flavin-dependent dehydrogenase